MNTYTGERLLLTLWIGSLWAIGYLAVPMAFATLDTNIAGDYAGRLFQAVNILGLTCGAFLLISRLFIFGISHFHRYWRSWLILALVISSAVFIVYLQPEMHEIKQLDWQQNTVLAEQFSQLHKLSQNIYLAMSLLGLMLVLTTDKKAEAEHPE